MLDVRTILCPTDLSESALVAFRLACALGREHGAHLVVFHAYPPPANGAEAVDRTRDRDFEGDLIETIRAHSGQHLGVVVDFRVAEGDPVEEILRAARDCDLIVMGTHGWTGIRRAILGSVAEGVLRKAHCPVVTLRPDARIPPESTPVAAAPSSGTVDLGVGD
jgi:nucleotide-binding universal stress UspA family protein